MVDAMVDAAHHPYMCGHQRALADVRRDLHDQVGSSLAGMIMAVEVAQLLIGVDSAEAQRVLTDLRGDVNDLIAQVRRIVAARDQPSGRHNAAVALRAMVGRMNRVTASSPVISLEVQDGVDAVAQEIGWAAFWIAREAITNVLKHAMARHCHVSLRCQDGELVVKIDDDGIGMAEEANTAGFGLINMAERAAEHGGHCTIGSSSLYSNGVAVLASLPLKAARDE